jgi:metalloprotein, YbeY/UPF0054 family
MKHEVIVEYEIDSEKVFCFTEWVDAALTEELVSQRCEVNILVANNEAIHAINLEMRQVDKPTDVLSFPMFSLTPGEPPDETLADPETGLVPLGDIVISLEQAAVQAEEYGHSPEHELAYLTVHSVLHLLGYDHLDEGEQKREMRKREKEIMEKINV